MHLLQAQRGEISDGSAPVDPGQSPADIVVLTANDAEIAVLAAAHARLGPTAPSLRLARLAWLSHPYSVDLYLDATLARSRLVVARVMGGAAYWDYALEQLTIRLGAAGVPFVALPGDDKPDPSLAGVSTVPAADRRALWDFLTEAGPDNAAGFLCHAAHMLGRGPRPPAATPLIRAGTYHPGLRLGDFAALRATWTPGAPTAALVFYRTFLQGAGLDPIDALIAGLRAEGLNPLPVFVASLKEDISAATLATLFAAAPPDIVLNATSFAVGSPSATRTPTPLDAPGVPVLQVVFAGGTEAAWAEGERGLGPSDIAMNVALPEIDGRILARAVAFKGELRRDAATECPILAFRPRPDRVAFTARLAAAWVRLRRTAAADRHVALILANYPSRASRLTNGVGLDTPASCAAVLAALASAGYATTGAPADGATLMSRLFAPGRITLPLATYRDAFARLPAPVRAAVTAQWGPPEADPTVADGAFHLPLHRFGNIVVGLQPARGYHIDPAATYHAPDLVPPHAYFAFYLWLRESFGAHAIVHLGKHGTLEWLPGKATALSESCFPEAVLGPMPHLYPFIVNDPGEGTQAKRRAQRRHHRPPHPAAHPRRNLRRAPRPGSPLDEYYAAATMDPPPPRPASAPRSSASPTPPASPPTPASRPPTTPTAACASSTPSSATSRRARSATASTSSAAPRNGRLETDLLAALARLPRGDAPADASLIRALADDLGLAGFDPLDCDLAAPWTGPTPRRPRGAARPLAHRRRHRRAPRSPRHRPPRRAPPPTGPASARRPRPDRIPPPPRLQACGPAETAALLAGLDGRFVAPGPSGAPTRGRPDVLPTGRNFFSLDSRAVPTPAAWALGWKSACRLLDRHAQDHGDWPRALVLTAWGTANMRTGGDDIAQALALHRRQARAGTPPRAASPATRSSRSPSSAAPASTSPCASPASSATPSRPRSTSSTAPPAPSMALDEPEADNPAAARLRTERARLAPGRRRRPPRRLPRLRLEARRLWRRPAGPDRPKASGPTAPTSPTPTSPGAPMPTARSADGAAARARAANPA